MQLNDLPIKKRPRFRLAAGIILLFICIGLCATSEYFNQLDHTQQQRQVDAVPTGTPLDPDPNAPVTCDGTPMTHDEECDHITTINGSSSTVHYSYAEQAAYQAQQRVAEVAADRDQERAKLQQNNGLSSLGWLSSLLCVAGLAAAFAALLAFVAYRKLRGNRL